ncbi:MAG TPA: hypothetical protein VFN35_08335, partial [Ktedonobacteraceae bacterium]|nr:hypothetical protein [Ktedonobacteraceae bacterium]
MRQKETRKIHVICWLILVRAVWSFLALLAAGLVVASILKIQISQQIVGDGDASRVCRECIPHFPLPGKQAMIVEPVLPGYVIYLCILCVIFALIYLLIGGVIIWRKPEDWMALCAAFCMVLLSVSFCTQLPGERELWHALVSRMSYLGLASLFLF